MEILAVNLLEAGSVLASETGWSKIPWAEFMAWQEVTETELTVWESQSLMLASAAYAAALAECYQKTVNAPYARKLTKRERKIEAAQAEQAVEAQFDRAWKGPENDA